MIRTTPFHPRTSEANTTGLWSHWSGYLSADRYQMADKFEYFAVRNALGVFDTSPLYKYRIAGTDAENFLAGVLIRDIRKCRAGQAHYTAWCDDDGWVIEDGVIFRLSDNEFLLTSARQNIAYLNGLTAGMSVSIEDVSEEYGALAVQGPYSKQILSLLAPEVESLGFFRLTETKIGNSPVTISRTGYTGDLGYEIWVPTDDALDIWDRLFEAATPYGAIPFGQDALLTTRIEAGLILIDIDYQSARYAWNDDQRASPLELNMGWMVRGLEDDDRPFIGRGAIKQEIEQSSSRWRTVGIVADWQEWDAAYNGRGLVPPKDHRPETGAMMLYDEDDNQVGWTPSFCYSPMLQRHIGIARLRSDVAKPDARLNLEVTIDHRYEMVGARVTGMPFYNPPRKTAR